MDGAGTIEPRAAAVLGAGGKMGARIARRIHDGPHRLAAVEIAAEGRARLEGMGISATDDQGWIETLDVVVLVRPGHVIERVAHGLVPRLRPGTIVFILGAAAPHAEVLPGRGA